MRFKIVSQFQTKCNICFEWITVQKYQKNILNVCQQCLKINNENYHNIRDTLGERYKLIIQKQGIMKADTQKQPESHQQLPRLSWPLVKSMIKDKQFSTEQKQFIQQKMEQFNRQLKLQTQNFLSFIKRLNTQSQTSSNIFQDNQQHTKQNYKSLIFTLTKNDQKQNKIHATATKKNKKLQDFCGKLDATRYIPPSYDYYFQPEILQQYAQSTKSGINSRTFGSQIFINTENLFLNLKQKKLSRIKSIRQASSNDVHSLRSNKRCDDNLKYRISAYLETKYQSPSLQRIIGSYVKQAYQNTKFMQKSIQLVSFRITEVDIQCYLSLIQFQGIQSLRMINVGLTDIQLHYLLETIWNKSIQSLVLTGNNLTQNGISMFQNRSFPFLKQIYLGKNRINKYRCKQNLSQMRSKFTIYI